MDGFQDKLERESRMIDQLNHILGSYVATGVNNPKKYPKEPSLSKRNDSEKKMIATTDEQRIAMVRIKYGKKEK